MTDPKEPHHRHADVLEISGLRATLGRAARLLLEAVVVPTILLAALLPLAALLLAWLSHNRGAVRRWTVAVVIGLTAAGLILHSRHDYLRQCLRTRTDQSETHCTEYTDAWRYASAAY